MTRHVTDMRRTSGEPLPAGMYRRRKTVRIAINHDCRPMPKPWKTRSAPIWTSGDAPASSCPFPATTCSGDRRAFAVLDVFLETPAST